MVLVTPFAPRTGMRVGLVREGVDPPMRSRAGDASSTGAAAELSRLWTGRKRLAFRAETALRPCAKPVPDPAEFLNP